MDNTLTIEPRKKVEDDVVISRLRIIAPKVAEHD